MNKKKFLIFGVLGIFALAVVSALAYYGIFSASFNVVSAVSVSGCSDTLKDVWSGDVVVGSQCMITNNASTEREINIINDADGENISVEYFKDVLYEYYGNIAGVQVNVTDDGEWLQWIYTYADTPTHTPKMTVAIDYPDGFAITTFDDGSHTGWYYAPDGETEVPLTGSETWVQTSGTANTLTVRIKKIVLDNEFHWHGYANYNGLGVWINSNETGTGYGEPPFEVTIRESIVNPITLIGGSSLVITPIYTIGTYATGEYTIETQIA